MTIEARVSPSFPNQGPVNVDIKALSSFMCLLVLAGCADPPGMRKPLPIDYQEQSRAQAVYRTLGPQLTQFPGVVGSYLTQSNNPRRIVVVVRDKAVLKSMKSLYGKERDGVKIRYEL